MQIPKYIEDLKTLCLNRRELASQRNQIYEEHIKKGRNFFYQQQTERNANKITQGIETLCDWLAKIEEIDEAIFHTDTMIASILESNEIDSIIRVKIPQKINKAGDIIPKSQFDFVPEETVNTETIQITPNDLWFLKMIKSAFGMQNTEVISKKNVELLRGDQNNDDNI